MTAWGGGTRPPTPRSPSRAIKIAIPVVGAAVVVAAVVGLGTKLEAAPVKPHTVYFVDILKCDSAVQAFRYDTLAPAVKQYGASTAWMAQHRNATSQVRMRAGQSNSSLSHLVARRLKNCEG